MKYDLPFEFAADANRDDNSPDPEPSHGRQAARTAGRAVGSAANFLSIVMYHLLWGGIAVGGIYFASAFSAPIALIATLVGIGLLIAFWTTGWQFWLF